jgi:hypothetical protein
VLLAVDLHEDFINKESITITSVALLQSSGVYSTEYNVPQPDGFIADRDSALSEKVFDISVAQIEAIIEPDSVADDIGWKSVAFICIHLPILAIFDG